MAIIYQNPNGKISGSLGPIYARIVKGRNIFAIKPIPTGRLYEHLSTAYQKFRTAAKFCSGITAIPKLRSLNEKLRGRFFSGYHALFSKNFSLVGSTAPTEYNKIVVEGFGMVMSNINVTESAVTATVPAMNSLAYIPSDGVNVRFLGSVVYSDPVEPEKDPPFQVTPLEKEVTSYNFAASYSFSESLDPVQLNLGTKYQRKTVFLLASVEDENGIHVINSDSSSAVV